VYIDGAPVRFQTLGTEQLGVRLVTSGIDQVSVVTGPSSALVSDASGGGVISYVTRAGGARFTGTFRAASDEAFGDATAVGYNRFEATLGGPLLTPHLTWFVSAALLGQGSDYRGLGAADQPTYVMGGLDTTVNITKGDGSGVQSVAIPKFVQSSGQCAAESNDDFACQGLRWAMDWSTARRGQAKLLYTYGAGSSFSITGVGSDLDQRTNPGSVIGDPSLYRGAVQSSRLAVVNWTQGLRSASNAALR
jgi:outer membrane receptor protein involved in Fe transport